MNASGLTRTSGPPSRQDGVTGMRPSLDAIDRAEAGGTTPTKCVARASGPPRLQRGHSQGQIPGAILTAR